MSLTNIQITPEDGWVELTNLASGAFSLPVGGQYCFSDVTPVPTFVGHRSKGGVIPFTTDEGQSLYVRVGRTSFVVDMDAPVVVGNNVIYNADNVVFGSDNVIFGE